MAAGIMLMLLLAVYVIFVASFYGDYITYDNMKYLARDLGAMSFDSGEYQSKIVYNGADDMSFAYFRNGVAVCTGDTYQYFDTTGSVFVKDSLNYTSPAVVPSEKYLMVYDVGGVGYSVYNQLTRIIDRKTTEKIVAADIADDGSMLLVTRSKETKYVVELYNAAFTKSMSIYKENYVIDAAVSPDGNRVIICSAVPTETDLDCEVAICKRGSAEAVCVLTYNHTMPLEVCAVDDGFVLLCDNGIRFMKYDGRETASYTFTDMKLKNADINDSFAAVVGSLNALDSENRVMLYSTAGETFGQVVSDNEMDTRVTGIYAALGVDGAYAYLKTPDSIIRLGDGDGESEDNTVSASGDVICVLPLTRGAMICVKTSAYLTFEK